MTTVFLSVGTIWSIGLKIYIGIKKREMTVMNKCLLEKLINNGTPDMYAAFAETIKQEILRNSL